MTIEERTEEILSQLTVEEKVAMCRANSKFFSNGVERLGIDELKMADGPHGIKEEYERYRWVPLGRKEDECTYLPTGVALASTWNKELFYDYGDALGGEARARGKDIILGPAINIVRTPLCGRNFEYHTEDTCLESKMVVPLIKGIQKNDVAACVKHYALNNQEWERTSVNVEVSDRALYETYLPGFEAAVKEGGAYAVMGAYNKVRGEHCCHSDFLVNKVLKGKFGFDGVYLTDWGGCHDLEEAVYNGLDLEMGTSEDFSEFYFTDKFVEMAKNSEEVRKLLDDKVRRILRLMIRVKKLDSDRYTGEYNTPRHQQIAYNVAKEAMVLLKNEDSVLPIKKDVKKILVIGENAEAKHALGGNSCYVRALYEISLLEGLKNRCTDKDIMYISGAFIGEKPIKPELTDIIDMKTGCRGFKMEAYDNLYCRGEPKITEYLNNPVLKGEPRTELTYRYFTTVNIPEDDEYKFVLSGRRGVRFYVNGKMQIAFDADETMKKKYVVQCRKGEKVKLMIEVQPQTSNPVLSIGWIRASEETDTKTEEILSAAKKADTVIYCGGLNHDYDGEGVDRADLKLPKEQNELIEKLLEIRPDLVVSLTCGSAVELPWIDKAKAVLLTWYAGMESGNAFADIILGNVSPSGHLPVTFPYKYEDAPVARYGDYCTGSEVYRDDIYVGYKGYRKDGIKPMFPFGHGLTYTKFEYSDFEFKDDTVSLTVKNAGNIKAYCVIQLYIGKKKENIDFPVCELKDFAKIELSPGETKKIVFKIGFEELKYYSEKLGKFVVDLDSYNVYIGESCENIIYSFERSF